MNIRHTLSCVFILLFALAAQPAASAAPSKKTDPRLSTLVSALQTVSPDPLGGRLGLEITATRVIKSELATGGRATQTAAIGAELRAYQTWKNAQKS